MTTTQINRRAPRGGMTAPNRTYQGGQFIPDAIWRQERAKARSDIAPLIDGFADDFQFLRQVYEQQVALRKLPPEALAGVQVIPASTVEARMKARIRDTYTRAFTLGKRHSGNLTTVNAADALAIKGTRLDEYQYLRGFLRDMDAGAGRMSYEKRADYYAKAARELFWLGFVLGDQSDTRRIEWVLGQTEHCKTCLQMAQGSPWRVGDILLKVKRGILPQSGALDCLGYHCQCSLADKET